MAATCTLMATTRPNSRCERPLLPPLVGSRDSCSCATGNRPRCAFGGACWLLCRSGAFVLLRSDRYAPEAKKIPAYAKKELLVRLLALFVCVFAMLSSVGTAAAEPEDGQTFDAAEYRIFYTQPRYGAVVPSPVKFSIRITGGFIVAREKACSPAGQCYGEEPELRDSNMGHCHTYVENLRRPGELAGFDASCTESFSIELQPGRYCAYADLTHNDHVARFKPGPRSLPPFDKVCFRVRPGASGNR